MNVYIWSRVANLTNNYHEEGGLVVVAPSLEEARAFMLTKPDFVRADCDAQRAPPSVSYALEVSAAVAPALFVFPDAGCC